MALYLNIYRGKNRSVLDNSSQVLLLYLWAEDTRAHLSQQVIEITN